jgi:hypothetical protein
MSCTVVVAPAIWPIGVTVGVSVGVAVPLLVSALSEVNCVLKELKELKTAEGCTTKVDGVIETKDGERIGVRVKQGSPVEFVVTDPKSRTLNRINQAYARLKVLDEVKKKGYQKVKEEKLPNGSIRMVVERWR